MAIYQHETVDVVPGKWEEYWRALEKHWLPVSYERGLIPVGFWQVVGASGRWPGAVALWEIADWDHFARLRHTQHTDPSLAPGLMWWIDHAWQYRSGGFDRILIPSPATPTIAEATARKLPAGAVQQEIVGIVPGTADAYLALVEQELIPREAARGRTHLGSYKSAFNDHEVLHLWGCPDWAHWAAAQAQEDSPALVEWRKLAQPYRTSWQAILLAPVPWSPLNR